MTTRRMFLTTVAAAIVTTPRYASADLLGGDIAVLLAQFEQQLQLVSNAIQTVSNLVQTVAHLGNVVKNGASLLKHAADNGLQGILDAAQGVTGLLSGVVRNLKSVSSDVQWWQTQLIGAKGLSTQSAQKLSIQRREWNMKTIQSASNALDAYKLFDDSIADLKQSQSVVQDASGTEGVVGQVQLLGRQTLLAHKTLLSLVGVQARGMQVLTNAEANRAFDEEQRRKNTEDLLSDWDEHGTPPDVYTELPRP